MPSVSVTLTAAPEPVLSSVSESVQMVRIVSTIIVSFIADLVLQVLAYCAQFEREAILTRQRQGIAEAKKRGVRFGRPRRKMPPEFAEAVEMVRCGEISGREAAQLCGMSY